jgi:hypothetical protein
VLERDSGCTFADNRRNKARWLLQTQEQRNDARRQHAAHLDRATPLGAAPPVVHAKLPVRHSDAPQPDPYRLHVCSGAVRPAQRQHQRVEPRRVGRPPSPVRHAQRRAPPPHAPPARPPVLASLRGACLEDACYLVPRLTS